MKIAITGISGFVGQNLKEHFDSLDGFQVRPINARKPVTLDHLADATALVHLAGKAHDIKRTSNDQEYFTVNRDLTKALFETFLKSPVRDFIFLSSVKAVADTLEVVLTEGVEPNPNTPYGQSKREAELYLMGQKLPEEKRLFIIRPCMIHGPGNKGNLNLLYKAVKKGIPYPLAAFKNERSFLSISNLIFVLEKIVSDSSIQGGIYNVSDDKALSTNDVIKIISSAIGRQPKLWSMSPLLISTLARIGDRLRLPLNSERLKKLTESYVVSNEKIKDALNVNQLPISSEEGLSTTIKSFRQI